MKSVARSLFLSVLFGLLSLIVLPFSLSAQRGVVYEKAGLNAALRQAKEKQLSVLVLLGSSSMGADELSFDEEMAEFLNRYFVTVAPIGRDAADVRSDYGLSPTAFTAMVLGADGSLSAFLESSSPAEIVALCESALRGSGVLFITPLTEPSQVAEVIARSSEGGKATAGKGGTADGGATGKEAQSAAGDLVVVVGQFAEGSPRRRALEESIIKYDLFSDENLAERLPEGVEELGSISPNNLEIYVIALEDLLEEESPIFDFYRGGVEVNRLAGDFTPEDFSDALIRAFTGRGVYALRARYEAGERDPLFLKEYMRVAKLAGVADYSSVALTYLSSLPEEQLLGEEGWQIFREYVDQPDERIFPFYLANRKELESLNGKKVVEEKFSELWDAALLALIVENDGVWSINEEQLKLLRKSMKRSGLSNVPQRIAEARIVTAMRNRDFKSFVTLVDERWSDGGLSYAKLYEWGEWLDRNCRDSELRFKASRWFYAELRNIEAYERMHGSSTKSYKAYFMRLADSLQH